MDKKYLRRLAMESGMDMMDHSKMDHSKMDMMKKDKMKKVMGEYKRGKLHSGSKKGPKVKNCRQAVAIGLNSARRAYAMPGM